MTYQYSTRGERTGKHITANGTSNVIAYYTWDGNGRLFQHDTGFSHPAGVSCVFYFYDALGRRIKKSGGSDSTDFTWSGEEEAGEIDANGNLTGRYIYGADGIVMNNDLYYFKNAHGDVTDILGITDASTGARLYEAFGEKIICPENDTNPFGYCGEYTDGESYLIYLRNRYYDPENGAFLSEDPIYDGTNWYTYCENDPVNHVDPWGLFDYDTRLSYSPNVYSNDVRTLQNELAWNGYLTDDDIDGYFGTKTLNAVNAYKNANGLWNFGEYAGVVGLTTWESLSLTYRTQADIDAGVTITNIGAKQYKDFSSPINNALKTTVSVAEVKWRFNYKWFISQVDHEAPWDIKREKSWNKTIGNNTYPGWGVQVKYNGNLMTTEELGNYTYGYIGAAMGLTTAELYGGSWYAAGFPTGGAEWTNEYNDWSSIKKGAQAYRN